MCNLKFNILAFTRYYLPGYRGGGPVRSIANMVTVLGDEFNFDIVTLDRDVMDMQPYKGVKHGLKIQFDKAGVTYLSASATTIKYLVELVHEYAPSVIYLNSFFDPIFTQRILWARRLGLLNNIPVLIAPRGEFSIGAMRLKVLRKYLYLRAAKLARIYNNLIWHASTDLECGDIRRVLPFVRVTDIHVAENLPSFIDGISYNVHVRHFDNALRVCFLSRITPIKNLDFALRALALVQSDVLFTIYGPKESPSYWASCESLIADLPPNVKVDYAGEVHPNEVRSYLAQHDLFFFPTRGENYGHVIQEALAAGLPVLLSDQTPWGEIVDKGVGWVLTLDNEAEYAYHIDQFATKSTFEIEKIKLLAHSYATERALDQSAIEANRRLFVIAIKSFNFR